MAKNQRHLHELLKEDQEPFVLKNYITDRRFQNKRAPTIKPYLQLQLQVKKRKPISQSASFPISFCKNACFSTKDSPDIRKSPLFDFQSPVKSPCSSSNALFLNIPAKTAAVLLEAALRIHKQTASSCSSKPKAHKNNNGFGLFGSILKKLTVPNRSRKREITGDSVSITGKDIRRWDTSVGWRQPPNENQPCTQGVMAFSGGCNDSSGSGIWSQSNEEKSFDFEASTSTSSLFEDLEEMEFESKHLFGEFHTENDFCESPFRFVLQPCPSSGQGTPEFQSPASSPIPHKEESTVTEGLQKEHEEKKEEEKEQCSPVSVLDPPFEDDEDDDNRCDDDEEDDSFDPDCSFAIVQRAKQQLLHKLRRFERLAELDPVELEKRMLEADDECDSDTDEQDEEQDYEDDQTVSLNNNNNVDWFVTEDYKRLMSDLIIEEERQQSSYNKEEVAKSVCKRLEAWKNVESNTIDMMVWQDFTMESVCWKQNQEQVEEAGLQIEIAIFGFLVEEFLTGI